MNADLRDLLHAAAPTDDGAGDELDMHALHTRVRARIRRRRMARVAGLVAVVGLAGGLTAVVLDDDATDERIDVVDVPTTPLPATTAVSPPVTAGPTVTSGPATAPTTPLLTLPADFGARAIAVAGDILWVGGFEQTGTWHVRQYSVASGELLATIPLPGAVRDLVVAGDSLWVWGGGDGGEPVGGVGLIDARDAELVATFGWEQDAPEDERISTYDLAVAGGTAWVSDAVGSRVFRLQPVDGGLEATPVATTGRPTDVLATDDGEVWVHESEARTIARIDPQTMAVVERNEWDGRRMAWDPTTRTVLTSTASQLEERTGFHTGTPIQTLPHTDVWDLDVDGLDVWVVEEMSVVHYRRSVPDGELERIKSGGWAEQITGLAVDGDTGWVVAGDEIGRLSPGAG